MPFFLFDIDNYQLITTPTVPGDISDTKDIILSEMPVPGLDFQPVQYGGGGNRKISFTLPIIKRNNTVGNIMLLKQFEMLRHQAAGFTSMFASQFSPNPKVIFFYGVGTIPLVYWVKKCDFVHKEGMANELANPKYTEIAFELWLDQNHIIYKGEEVFRRITSYAGMADGIMNIVMSQINKKYNPY
jgi:hypothetical protein